MMSVIFVVCLDAESESPRLEQKRVSGSIRRILHPCRRGIARVSEVSAAKFLSVRVSYCSLANLTSDCSLAREQ